MVASALLAPLVAEPARSALILDVDGTLAPIVPRPRDASVPDTTRAVLRSLAARYRLVACVSGRPGGEAAAIVGLPELRYVGNHGLELHPDRSRLEREIAAFRATLDASWPVEDKLISLSLHFRQAGDQKAARDELEAIAERALASGLDPRWGRKVLEIRPRVDADKGTAVSALIAGVDVDRGLYAGDDTTDLDAFCGLRAAGLGHAVCVAVASAEAPEQLLAAADLVVAGVEGLEELLRAL